MFHDFSHRHTPCTVNGLPEAVILSRGSSGSSQFGRESDYIGRFAPESSVVSGALIETGETFLVCSQRPTPERDKYCGMVKTNMIVKIQRYSQKYDGNYNPIGDPDFLDIETGVHSFVRYVNGQLRQEDPGLLPTSTHLVRLQNTVDVRRPDDPKLLKPDRIVFNGRPYQVDDINDIQFPGLYQIQLSEDMR
ncbi:hypothetical protein M2444_005370 [Paenibacillus sp. PastF-3]|uniref:hypothetical protein n=1 Tax=Paenibacillus sp. PastF-3 TaxID=2940626 RepID=UPI0024760100|nr:hypothetical protein [Paenibacillus sp. PastF-3]MDH6373538.1 hypothetical protein [Paenibacillus sp. PastF-3]